MKWFVAISLKIACVIIAVFALCESFPHLHPLELVFAGIFIWPNRWILKTPQTIVAYLLIYGAAVICFLIWLQTSIASGAVVYDRSAGSMWMAACLLFLPGASLFFAWIDGRSPQRSSKTSRSAAQPRQDMAVELASAADVQEALASSDPTDRAWAEAELLRLHGEQPITIDESGGNPPEAPETDTNDVIKSSVIPGRRSAGEIRRHKYLKPLYFFACRQ